MKAVFLGFPLGGLLAYFVCALVGAMVPPGLGSNITSSEAEAALTLSFSDAVSQSDQWYAASGHASHGWFIRRASVTALLGSDSGTVYSEQVLKVGWPFTVVRGFIRTVGFEMNREGARLIASQEAAASHRMVPTQPVWPGVAFFGLLGALGFAVAERRRVAT